MAAKYTTHVSRNVAQRLDPKLFPPETCIISINEPEANDGDARLAPEWFKVLRVRFWDVIKESESVGGKIFPMTEEQAKEIATFIKENWDRSILVHCRAGISRSAGIVEVLQMLGWQILPIEMRPYYMNSTDVSFGNVHVKRLLMNQFPELDLY